MSKTDIICGNDYKIFQVKLWSNEGTVYQFGDSVPEIHSFSNYLIVVREGYTIRVENCVLIEARPYNKDRDSTGSTFDKWGNPFSENNTYSGTDSPYFYSEHYHREINPEPLLSKMPDSALSAGLLHMAEDISSSGFSLDAGTQVAVGLLFEAAKRLNQKKD